jgi:hypothetical protein
MTPRRSILLALLVILVLLPWVMLSMTSPAFARSEPLAEPTASSSHYPLGLSQNIELIDHIGSPGAIEVQGGYAYIIYGSELVITNISDPSDPQQVGSILMSNRIENMSVSDQYIYLTVYNQGLKIVNVSNPTAPVEVGSYAMPLREYDIVVVGKYAYMVAGHWAGQLIIVDVSNPSSPVKAASLPIRAYYIEAQGHYLYYTHWTRGLVVMDISNPVTPVEIGSLELPGPYTPNGIAVEAGYIYLPGLVAGIAIVDVSNPAHPEQVSTISNERGIGNIAVIGDHVYTLVYRSDDRSTGLRIVNISDPTEHFELSFHELPAPTHMVASVPYLYVTDGINHLNVIDVSNPQAPSAASSGTEGTAIYADSMFRVGQDYLYLVPSWRGGVLKVVDVSNRAKPVVVNSVDNWGGELEVVGNYAYLAAGNLKIFDVSNPLTPTLLGSITGSYDVPLDGYDVAVHDGYAYLPDNGQCDRDGCYDQGLWIVDVSDPVAPTVVTFHEGPHSPVEMVGDYLYFGWNIMDLSNPTQPVRVGAAPAYFNYIVVEDRLYSTTGTAINIFDISNPAAPKQIGTYSAPTLEFPGVLSADTNRLFAASVSGPEPYRTWRMLALDVTNPNTPLGLGIYTMPGTGVLGGGIGALASTDDYIYTVGSDGLFALHYTGGTFTIHASYLPLMHVNR